VAAKIILVIENSDTVRSYLCSKLKSAGFEVLETRNGFEGLIKLKNTRPDLVIMEYSLPRASGVEVLEEKSKSKAVADVPVIMFTTKVDRGKIQEVAKFGLTRLFAKPLRVDTLMKAVSEVLGVEISLDTTPCNIDVHMNERVLFIELAQGLNEEKIELMGYKIREILELYGIQSPAVLVIMTAINLDVNDESKLSGFFKTILEASGASPQAIRVLTTSSYVRRFLSWNKEFAGAAIVGNLTEALDQLLGIKVSNFVEEGRRILTDDYVAPKKVEAGEIQIHYEVDKGYSVAVVDDDPVTRGLVIAAFSKEGWEVVPYEDGKAFLEDLGERKFDLVFLDILMPVLDGFAVLNRLKAAGSKTPVIILSAVSQRETVVKALGFGVRSYLAKPLGAEDIQRKAAEILKLDF
jgi:DNA-binding response OmpR family regulator